MSMAEDLAGRVRLGGFQLDLDSGELCALGAANGNGKVLLREQPFQVLRMLIARGGKMAENQANDLAAMQKAQQEYIRQAAGTASSPAEEIARLVELKQQGAIDEAEFQALKAKALA